MKYICTESEEGVEEIFVFPKTVDHDVMAEGVEGMKNRTRDPWKRIYRMVKSAGFIDARGTCFGKSETLGIKSRGEIDTALFKAQQNAFF